MTFEEKIQCASFSVYRIVYLLHLASFEAIEVDKSVLNKNVKNCLNGVDIVYNNLKLKLKDIDFEDVFQDFGKEKESAVSNIFAMICNMDEEKVLELEEYLIKNK